MLRDETVQLPGGPRLALRRADGPGRAYLLVHGLASNARLWDGVALRLAEAGHPVTAVDLRGHGHSERTEDGYTTEQCAADLAALCALLGWEGPRAPIAAGQSWGAHVVLALAQRPGAVAALALVDGGWFVLGERFPTFEACWEELAPPRFDGVRLPDLESRIRAMHPDWPDQAVQATLDNLVVGADGSVQSRLRREHHRQILKSMYDGDPRPLFPRVTVPTLLAVAGGPDDQGAPAQAARLLPDAELRWYPGADHDLHAQHPQRLADDLLTLAERVGPP